MRWQQRRLDKLIQPVKVDVAQNWTDHTPLRDTDQAFVVLPIFKIPGLEQVGEQAQEAVVVQPLAQNRQHGLMVETVKAAGNIALDVPLHPSPVPRNLLQRRVTTTAG